MTAPANHYEKPYQLKTGRQNPRWFAWYGLLGIHVVDELRRGLIDVETLWDIVEDLHCLRLPLFGPASRFVLLWKSVVA